MALDGQRVAKRSGWFCADGTTKAVSDVKFKTCTNTSKKKEKKFRQKKFSNRVDEPTATRRTQKKIKAKEMFEDNVIFRNVKAKSRYLLSVK